MNARAAGPGRKHLLERSRVGLGHGLRPFILSAKPPGHAAQGVSTVSGILPHGPPANFRRASLTDLSRNR